MSILRKKVRIIGRHAGIIDRTMSINIGKNFSIIIGQSLTGRGIIIIHLQCVHCVVLMHHSQLVSTFDGKMC